VARASVGNSFSNRKPFRLLTSCEHFVVAGDLMFRSTTPANLVEPLSFEVSLLVMPPLIRLPTAQEMSWLKPLKNRTLLKSIAASHPATRLRKFWNVSQVGFA
jgi:hypothetical protein